MKRRTFSLLASVSLMVLKTSRASATASNDASLLTTTLTQMGAERAGNADGSIPAWTGGLTTLLDGLKPNDYVPELFPEEQPLVVIDSSNMADHADRLSEGVMAMMTKYGYTIKVYPTHRTAAAPQGVYDCIAQNLNSAQLDSRGGRFGFNNAFGGIPFPIPDASDPVGAGAQIMWNNVAKWWGYAYNVDLEGWVVSNDQLSLAFKEHAKYYYPYYVPNGSLASYNGILQQQQDPYFAPQNLVGQNIIVWTYNEPYDHPQQAWELLNGQGRVRRAPEIAFDTPSSNADGICGYDEYYGFNGSLERYDWKCLGKKEMYIPYNNNGLYASAPEKALQSHFIDPNLVRWELHRCWVVEAVLHPGERNVLARRQFYIDEDTWIMGVGDAWDANDKLFKVNLLYNNCRPDLPGTVAGQNTIHNLQTDDYASVTGYWNQAVKSTLIFVTSFPESTFDPANMAAAAQY
jgi:hypothetical protein